MLNCALIGAFILHLCTSKTVSYLQSPHSAPHSARPSSEACDNLKFHEQEKVMRYGEACVEAGIRFFPIAIDIHGDIGPFDS